MKKSLCLSLAVLLLAILLPGLASCGEPVSNGLLARADGGLSPVAFFSYDGSRVSSACTGDMDAKKEIFAALDAVEATEAKQWSLDDVTLPIYGLEIPVKPFSGAGLVMAWSNDYLIMSDGTAYRFKFDFAGLERQYFHPEEPRDSLPPSFRFFPCARLLTQDERGWNPALLTPADAPSPPDGVTATLAAQGADTLTVILENTRASAWTYGEPYLLDALLGGVWYGIPALPPGGGWAFHAMAHTVQPGGREEHLYSLSRFGALPAGAYRLVGHEGISVEFTVPQAAAPRAGFIQYRDGI